MTRICETGKEINPHMVAEQTVKEKEKEKQGSVIYKALPHATSLPA